MTAGTGTGGRRPARVVVVGSTNLDLVVRTPRIPRPGETVLGEDLRMIPGGKGANQAVAAARLGAEVTLVARTGGGAFGEVASRGFIDEGIRTDYTVRDEEAAQGVALILVDREGENAIAVAPGANARLTADDVARAEPAIAAADVLLLQLEVPLAAVAEAVRLGRRHGRRIILNPAPYRALPPDILAGIDILTPNETEAAMLLGGGDAGLGGVEATGMRLLDLGVGCVLITLGREGVFAVSRSERRHVPGLAVEAVDTTAAGDSFSGALAVWLAEGADLAEAVRAAVAASALTVTRMGAQSSLPARAEVEALLAAGPSNCKEPVPRMHR